MFLTTHYMDEAERVAQRIAIIDHGKIVAEDSPQGLKTADRHGLARRGISGPDRFDDSDEAGNIRQIRCGNSQRCGGTADERHLHSLVARAATLRPVARANRRFARPATALSGGTWIRDGTRVSESRSRAVMSSSSRLASLP